MTNKQTILAFVERINARDVEGLAALMSGDHTFIDARQSNQWQRDDDGRLARLLRMVP